MTYFDLYTDRQILTYVCLLMAWAGVAMGIGSFKA